MADDIREPEDDTLESLYGEIYKNKRFDYFNLLNGQINKEKDMAYFLSLFESGDHRYSKYDIFEFMVYDNQKKYCTDEQLSLVIEK